MLSELDDEHRDEMSQLKLELTSRLTDSMVTAHHAEIQQAQVCTSEDSPMICFAVQVVPSWSLSPFSFA